MKSTTGRGDNRGFTLAELLIAIVIFSVVVAMVYGSYNMTFRVISNADAHSVYGERARITMERFVEDLESYHGGQGGSITGETESFGEYRGDAVRFTTRSHLIFHKSQLPVGYATVLYSVEEGEDGMLRLYRADIPHYPGTDIDDEEKGFLLCDGLREVAITYYDEDGNETDSWDEPQKAPFMVQLRIGFAHEEGETETIYFSTGVALPGGV